MDTTTESICRRWQRRPRRSKTDVGRLEEHQSSEPYLMYPLSRLSITLGKLPLGCALLLTSMSLSQLHAEDTLPSATDAPLLQACQALLNKEVNQKEWTVVLTLTHQLKQAVDAKLPFQPYEEALDLEAFATLPNAESGRQSLLFEVRYASKLPPGPGGSFISESAVFLEGDLLAAPAKEQEPGNQQQRKPYDGYISDSVVVVSGRMQTTSYLFNSIVVATGPIEIEGYIHNSLVISLDDLARHEGEAPIPSESPAKRPAKATVKVKDGYISNSVVIGVVDCNDLRDSIVLGQVIGPQPDLRGAEIYSAGAVARLPWEIGKSATTE